MSKFKDMLGNTCDIDIVEDERFKIIFAKDVKTNDVVVLEFKDKRFGNKKNPRSDDEASTPAVRKK